MKTIKIKLKVDDYTEKRLSEFKNINRAVSDIVTQSFLKSPSSQFDSKNVRGILDRTYAYHKRVQPNIQYTRQQFVDHYIKDPLFIKLFNEYAESNYDKQLMPSFKKAPKLEDVELMTYGDLMMSRNTSTPVVFVQIGFPSEKYESINKASKATGFSTGRIIRCLKLGASERKGADKWFYSKEEFKKFKKKQKDILKDFN